MRGTRRHPVLHKNVRDSQGVGFRLFYTRTGTHRKCCWASCDFRLRFFLEGKFSCESFSVTIAPLCINNAN